jgi:hypothetical protein
MISPAIAGNDSRCGIALHVFLGKLSAISSQYAYPIGDLSVKRRYDNLDLEVAENAALREFGPRPESIHTELLYLLG